MIKWNILDDDNNVVQLDNIDEQRQWQEKYPLRRFISKTVLPNGKIVSTVLLTSNLGDHPFETMVFPGEGNYREDDCCQSMTYDQAVEAHMHMVELWRNSE